MLERIEGEKVSEEHGLEPEQASELARAFFRAYVRQITIEGVYHADPHRGNILITPEGRLALLDFGLLGRLDDDTRRVLALLLLAIAQNRADDVADLILALSLTTTRLRPGGVRPRDPPQAAALPLAAARRHPRRRGARRPPADRAPLRDPAPDELRARRQDARAGGLDRPRARPAARPDRADGGGRARGDVPRAGASARAERPAGAGLHAGRAAAADAAPRRPHRHRARARTLKVGVEPTGLDELEHALRSVANRVGASFIIVGLLIASALLASTNEVVALTGFSIAARARALHALEDLPHARRALAAHALELDERDPRPRAQARAAAGRPRRSPRGAAARRGRPGSRPSSACRRCPARSRRRARRPPPASALSERVSETTARLRRRVDREDRARLDRGERRERDDPAARARVAAAAPPASRARPPRRLTASVRSRCSTFVSSSRSVIVMPAELTSMSSRPNRASCSATRAGSRPRARDRR